MWAPRRVHTVSGASELRHAQSLHAYSNARLRFTPDTGLATFEKARSNMTDTLCLSLITPAHTFTQRKHA